MVYSMTEIKARYQETDKMGVTYHGNYATWFEAARTDYIHKLDFSYADMGKEGIISPVVGLQVQYKKSIFYPEKVKMKTWVEHYSRLHSTYCYEIYNKEGELATTGSTQLLCIKVNDFRPIRLDHYLPEWHQVYSKAKALSNEGKELEITQRNDLNI